MRQCITLLLNPLKFFFILLFWVGSESSLNAQIKKKVVAITKIETSSYDIPKDLQDKFYQSIVAAFVTKNRFQVLDKSQLESVLEEQYRLRGDDYVSAENAAFQEKIKNLGAEYLITPKMISFDPHKSFTIVKKTEVPVFEVSMSFSLNAVNTFDGVVVGSEVIREVKSSTTSYGSAYSRVINSIKYDVSDFIEKYFPLKVEIVEINKVKRKKATYITILVGKELGINVGNKLKVVESIPFKGLSRTRELGIIKVKKVEGENFSFCKVRSGGEAILSRFNEGANIYCVTLRSISASRVFDDVSDVIFDVGKEIIRHW